MRLRWSSGEVVGWIVAVAGPTVLTAALAAWGGHERRDYAFLYLGLVAVLGVLCGPGPVVVATALSILLVDLFLVPPVLTLTIADGRDVVDVLAFAVTAGVVGLLASRRRRALLRSETLAGNLRQTNAGLARLNEEQAAAAQAALAVARSQERVRALEEVERTRRELLANVSHELRAPLSTILTESTSGLTSADGSSEADRRLVAIAGEARRLELLVDDMLDLAVIESGTLELRLEPASLGDAIDAAIERLHRTSPERPVEWDETAAHVDVLVDRERLLQVLDNLLANADRSAPEGTPIDIGVEPDGAGAIAVRVRDRGPGVTAELRPRLFERFAHGQSRDGAAVPVSTGLGLAIVKGLVEAHAGTVALEDHGGPGASFRFTLPLADGQR